MAVPALNISYSTSSYSAVHVQISDSLSYEYAAGDIAWVLSSTALVLVM